MARALMCGTMLLPIAVSGMRTKSMEEEFMNGLMEDAMKEIGRIITCTAVAFTLGKMADAMKVSTITTGNTAMVLTHGKMEDSMWVTGRMVNNMAKDFTDKVTARNAEAFGRMARESNGVMNEKLTHC